MLKFYKRFSLFKLIGSAVVKTGSAEPELAARCETGPDCSGSSEPDVMMKFGPTQEFQEVTFLFFRVSQW